MTDRGFTLIELLVAIVVLSVLSAIALPSLLSTINRARSIAAISAIDRLMAEQEAYFLEHNEFSSFRGTVPSELENYKLVVDPFRNHRKRDGTSVSGLRFRAIPQSEGLRQVMGKAWVDEDYSQVICVSDEQRPFMRAKVYCP